MNDLNKNFFLFVVNSFPPYTNQNSLRAIEISKRIVNKDFYPLILTRKLVKREPKDYSLIRKIPSQLEIYRTPVIELKRRYSLKTLVFKFLAKIVNAYFYLHWVPFAYLSGIKILKIREEIKFIYSTGPPFYSHLIAYLLKRKFKIPLFIEYRDPWNFNPYSTYTNKTLAQNLSLRIERKILRLADVIIVVSSALKSFLTEKFPEIKQKPIYPIENGLNIEDFSLPVKSKDNKITFTFIGSLYGKRDITPLLKIISDLEKGGIFKEKEFLLKIFGNYDKEYLKSIIEKLKIQDLVYLGEYLTRLKVFEEILKCDLTVHVGENIDYPTISYKVWDYLSSKKKVLYLGLEDSYTADFLRSNNFGIIIPLNNLIKGREIFKNLIRDINQHQFQNTINQQKIEEFTWDNKIEKLLLCIKENL